MTDFSEIWIPALLLGLIGLGVDIMWKLLCGSKVRFGWANKMLPLYGSHHPRAVAAPILVWSQLQPDLSRVHPPELLYNCITNKPETGPG